MSPLTLSFFKTVLAILDLLNYHVNFRFKLLDFLRNFTESVGEFGEYCHLNNTKFSNL